MSDGMMLATIKEIRYFKEINAMTRRYLKNFAGGEPLHP
jgi:hypothetical protein